MFFTLLELLAVIAVLVSGVFLGRAIAPKIRKFILDLLKR